MPNCSKVVNTKTSKSSSTNNRYRKNYNKKINAATSKMTNKDYDQNGGVTIPPELRTASCTENGPEFVKALEQLFKNYEKPPISSETLKKFYEGQLIDYRKSTNNNEDVDKSNPTTDYNDYIESSDSDDEVTITTDTATATTLSSLFVPQTKANEKDFQQYSPATLSSSNSLDASQLYFPDLSTASNSSRSISSSSNNIRQISPTTSVLSDQFGERVMLDTKVDEHPQQHYYQQLDSESLTNIDKRFSCFSCNELNNETTANSDYHHIYNNIPLNNNETNSNVVGNDIYSLNINKYNKMKQDQFHEEFANNYDLSTMFGQPSVIDVNTNQDGSNGSHEDSVFSSSGAQYLSQSNNVFDVNFVPDYKAASEDWPDSFSPLKLLQQVINNNVISDERQIEADSSYDSDHEEMNKLVDHLVDSGTSNTPNGDKQIDILKAFSHAASEAANEMFSELQDDNAHEEINRTSSETLAQEFKEYVTREMITNSSPDSSLLDAESSDELSKPLRNQIDANFEPKFSESDLNDDIVKQEYDRKLAWAIKLGYNEKDFLNAIMRLGVEARQNDILGMLLIQTSDLTSEEFNDPTLDDFWEIEASDKKSEKKAEEPAESKDKLRPIVIDGSNVAIR